MTIIMLRNAGKSITQSDGVVCVHGSLLAIRFAKYAKKAGKTVPAEDVHHIISFMSTNDSVERKRLAYDYDNLMSLCKQCHQNIHNERIR